MKKLLLLSVLAATPAAAQNQTGQLPGQAACSAVRDRVQVALAQADRALQTEDTDGIQRWTDIGANYAEIFATFCNLDALPE